MLDGNQDEWWQIWHTHWNEVYWELYESFHKGDFKGSQQDIVEEKSCENEGNNEVSDSSKTAIDADEVLESASQCGLSRKSDKTGIIFHLHYTYNKVQFKVNFK